MSVAVAAPLWATNALCGALQPLAIRGHLPAIQGISIDSRTLETGDLFIALAGDPGPGFHTAARSERNGHDHVNQAAAKGASAALVEHFIDSELPQIRVANTLDGLWALARASRKRSDARVVALTGSSGKTTLKQFLAAALEGYADPGGLNNFWGLPLSLARMPPTSQTAIFELGMNHPGEIAPLAQLALPEVAVVLNVLPVHLEKLGSLAAIAQEKLAITAGLDRRGTLILPDVLPQDIAWQGELLRFGESKAADVRLVSKGAGADCQIVLDGKSLAVTLPLGGRHRQLTATATLACALALSEDVALAAQRLAQVRTVAGRGNEIALGSGVLIDESYNANPVSVQYALQGLQARSNAKRKYAILGDMLELGEDREAFHIKLAQHCLGLDGLWLVGSLMPLLAEHLPASLVCGCAASADKLPLEEIAARVAGGGVLLIKGSNKVFWQHGFVAKLTKCIAASARQDSCI